MVTAETAATIPVVLLVLALVLTSVRVSIDQVRCVDAARAGARAAARGDDERAVRDVAAREAPRGASVEIVRSGGDVTVTVVAPPIAAVPLVGGLPAPSGRAVTTAEGGATDALGPAG
ncbi:TadE family type IV pilus minor pilin [Mobilicoccus pelagius]|uniref:Pilus assembly protein TadE n=1 Tax=Mobilicoccus pelagius NBRC 104925 TaxID=1089455 RepID=H5UNW7_9MICO|nr:TadE family type IV pilus minor pilin [Mobilicoccus pelagius]GAB47425.1 hypothetical protein MOPEL_011_00070 [Mobilicoccus pelagius NBRC 104925]